MHRTLVRFFYIRYVVSEICASGEGQTDRQTDRHLETLIAILRSPTGEMRKEIANVTDRQRHRETFGKNK